MTIEERIFQGWRIVRSKCLALGFVERAGALRLEAPLLDGAFTALVTVDKKGCVTGTVIDAATGEEYLPLRQLAPVNYAAAVREAYERLLEDIVEACGEEVDGANGIRRAWVLPANPTHFDVFAAFAQCPDLRWHQRANVRKGDTVYIYMGAPYSSIVFRCTAVAVDLKPSPDNTRGDREMILRMRTRYADDAWPRARLQELGLSNIRGLRTVPRDLDAALRR